MNFSKWYFFLSCVFVTLEKEKDLGENMLSRLCSDCLPFLQIGLFEANIDIFLDLLSCHHLARLFEVVVRRNLQKYVRGKVDSQRLFCFILTIQLFTFSWAFVFAFVFPRCCVTECASAGWQKLAAFWRGQNWPQKISSSAYSPFSRGMRCFSA